MSDRYTYCVSDASGTAQGCVVTNHPLTPAEVNEHISIDLSVPPGNELFGTAPVLPQDQPWYRDVLDTVTNWIASLSAGEIGLGVAVIIILAVLVRSLRSSDLADDAYEAEDRIEDLNYQAHYHVYSGTGEEEEEEA